MRTVIALLAVAAAAAPAGAQAPSYARTEDVIYGRKYGLALTLDVYAPKDPAARNGAGVVYCVSGGWFSDKGWVPFVEPNLKPFLARGYTVFAVVHASQPE